jgi:hypothetical protein
MNTFCYWCLKQIKTDSLGIIQLSNDRDIFFCSKECADHATIKIKGKKEIDFNLIRKHANQIKRKQEREKKSRLLSSILKKEKLNSGDLAALHCLLNPKQRLVLAIVGLSNLSWAVHREPKALITKIDDLVKNLHR